MMTNDEFWAKFQILYESVENDNILYKKGTVVNCFDDGEKMFCPDICFILTEGKKAGCRQTQREMW